MDDSILIELTKCFATLAKGHDGTFLKMWSDEGTFKFHFSNNNVRQPSFQHSTFSKQSISTPEPKPSYGRKLGEKGDKKQSQSDEEGAVDEQNEDNQPEDGQTEDETEDVRLDDEQQMRDVVKECGVESDKVILSTPDKFQEYVNSPDYPHTIGGRFKGGSKKGIIYSWCEKEYCRQCESNVILQNKHGINSRIKIFCDTHRDSHWHELTPQCKCKVLTYPQV